MGPKESILNNINSVSRTKWNSDKDKGHVHDPFLGLKSYIANTLRKDSIAVRDKNAWSQLEVQIYG